MSDYPPGHVKRDRDTRQIAIRTIHDFPGMQWSVATASAGARHADTTEVDAWEDVDPAPTEPAP